jgi:uncharacterized protein CbrC (UPF0167 family)
MTFKYFDRPDLYTGFLDKEVKCDSCKQTKICFDAEAFYGYDSMHAVCPECLVSGKLIDRDFSTNTGDINELKRQLKTLNPNLTDKEIEAIAKEKTEEFEKTTPHLITWQDWDWPCSEGDYCKFIGFGSRPMYNRLAQNNNGRELFENSFYYRVKNESDETLWDNLLAEEEIKNYEESNEYGVLFYVFKSLNSDKIITTWDCD